MHDLAVTLVKAALCLDQSRFRLVDNALDLADDYSDGRTLVAWRRRGTVVWRWLRAP
jgi:hypothetical protein